MATEAKVKFANGCLQAHLVGVTLVFQPIKLPVQLSLQLLDVLSDLAHPLPRRPRNVPAVVGSIHTSSGRNQEPALADGTDQLRPLLALLLLPLSEVVPGHLGHVDLAALLFRQRPAFPFRPVAFLYLPDDVCARH